MKEYCVRFVETKVINFDGLQAKNQKEALKAAHHALYELSNDEVLSLETQYWRAEVIGEGENQSTTYPSDSLRTYSFKDRKSLIYDIKQHGNTEVD